MILVNFKLYKTTFGDGAVRLAEICKQVGEKYKIPVIPVVAPVDLRKITEKVKITTLVQHIDPLVEGKWTGKISGQQMSEAGARGTLLNHSEDKMPKGSILATLKILPKDFWTVLCVRSIKQASFWVKKEISYIAYEPSWLIGSKDKSVATENPEVIGNMAKICGDIPLLVGAGIKSKKDVEVAIRQGAKGILVSSAVVESSEPEKVLSELADGF